MPSGFTRLSRLLLEAPRLVKLGYCLFRDDRVPAPPKAALVAAFGLIVSPIDVPAWIPILGDLDMLALAVLALKIFVDACPQQVVEEHRAAIKAGDSIFDRDLRTATTGVRTRAATAWQRVRQRAQEGWRRGQVESLENVSA
jgi:uncharacterized membrane protein YkvA (DUF1232 family)